MKKSNDEFNKNVEIEDNSPKSTFKKIINIIEYSIIFIVVFCNGFLIGRAFKNPNKTPDLFGEKAYIIVSGSMIPTIQIGDVVLVHSTEDANIGDVIAFKRQSKIIVHRVVDEKKINGKTMYQTKGDNNNIADLELVDKHDIEGVQNGKIPYIGNIIIFLYEHLAIVVVVLVLIMLIRLFI